MKITINSSNTFPRDFDTTVVHFNVRSGDSLDFLKEREYNRDKQSQKDSKEESNALD